jgi:hypothetical protein
MAARPYIPPYAVITNASMATTVHSSPTNIQQLSLASYSFVWTGVPVGTFTLEGSDDYTVKTDGTVLNTGTWNTLPVSNTIAAAGTSGNGIYDIALTGITWVRLTYTAASGTGNLNALFAGKVT